jgi:hypothetical protein
MASNNANYIDYLSSYLENEKLHYIIKNYKVINNESILIIKDCSLYNFLKVSKNIEKSQYVEEKLFESIGNINNYYKDTFKTIIFICIFTEHDDEIYRLTTNLPKFNSSYNCNTSSFSWRSNNNLINSIFIEDVKNLLTMVCLKPAKRS